ncbi:MAG: SusC/RagA family TonB-linked outer membrane protein, partial [Dysgonomonas sp.]
GFAVYQYDLAKDKYTKYGEYSFTSYNWSSGDYFEQKLYLETGLEYSNTFDEKHNVTALFLGNRNSRIIRNFIGFADQGLVGRLTYDFDKRYFGEFNVGYNGSENFAKGKRYGFFPAFSGGWLISNEKFIASNTNLQKYISLLKIRGSLGWVGNDKYGDIYQSGDQDNMFMYFLSFTNGSCPVFVSGNTSFGGIYQGKVANEDVTWETGRKMNLGFESSFFREKIGFNMDLFHERRVDILTDISSIIPSHVGASFKASNVGIVENKGVEFEVVHRGNIGKDFNYSVKGNYSFTKNKVVKKADPAGMLAYQKEEGYSIGVPLTYKYIGIFQDYADIYSSPNQMTLPGNVEVKPGDLKYLDFNNDGQIDINDAFRQGYGSVPEVQYGITLSVNFQNFDFSVMIQGSARSQFGKNWEIMWPFSNADNVYEKHWRYWSPEMAGNEEFIRLYGAYQNNEPGGASGSTYSYSSGDYVRLKTFEVGYTLPKKAISKLYMSSVRVYFSGNNVLSWIKDPYLDPDNRDQRGGVMPPTRAFNFGVNINF